jgi:hypothetical protein
VSAPRIFEHADGVDVLVVTARHHRPVTDELLVQVFHRTVGATRSALLDRAAVAELHDALGQWLQTGWPGVAKTEGRSS